MEPYGRSAVGQTDDFDVPPADRARAGQGSQRLVDRLFGREPNREVLLGKLVALDVGALVARQDSLEQPAPPPNEKAIGVRHLDQVDADTDQSQPVPQAHWANP